MPNETCTCGRKLIRTWWNDDEYTDLCLACDCPYNRCRCPRAGRRPKPNATPTPAVLPAKSR